jgi:hypothetical protein
VQVEIVQQPATFDEMMQQLGHLPTIEECDAEIVESLEAHVQRTREFLMSHASRRTVWERPQ